MDEIAEDIIYINKQYSDGFELTNSVKNILNSASYYDDPYEQVAAVTRRRTGFEGENASQEINIPKNVERNAFCVRERARENSAYGYSVERQADLIAQQHGLES